MTDLPLFKPRDRSVPKEARPRLSKQCEAILERLKQGPATNRELAALSLKYTSRISDLRKAGIGVKCVRTDPVSGLSVYELEAA